MSGDQIVAAVFSNMFSVQFESPFEVCVPRLWLKIQRVVEALPIVLVEASFADADLVSFWSAVTCSTK